MGGNLSLVLPVLVLGHQSVVSVVHMSGVVELEAAVVLRVVGHMDFSADVFGFVQYGPVIEPLERGLGVASHSERDAPVMV